MVPAPLDFINHFCMASSPEIDDSAIDQLTRFNEGVDQALSESTVRFMQEIEKSQGFSYCCHSARSTKSTQFNGNVGTGPSKANGEEA
jgi:hypothetical protein